VAAVVAEVEGEIPLLLVPPVLPARPVVAAVEEGEEEEVVVRRRGRPRAGSAPLRAAGPPDWKAVEGVLPPQEPVPPPPPRPEEVAAVGAAG